MDYGVWVKKTYPNPSRRSRHHSTQTAFVGSRRQLRAQILRALLDAPPGPSVDPVAPESAAVLDIAQIGARSGLGPTKSSRTGRVDAEGFLLCSGDRIA